jgi:hypothetical protein
MKATTVLLPAAALAILGMLAPMPARAAYWDIKYYSAGALCTPYTSSPSPDYSKLRFRPGGVSNEDTRYQYVICSLGTDSEDEGGSAGYRVTIGFRANTEGTDQCTLTFGTNADGTVNYTDSVAGVPGESTQIQFYYDVPVMAGVPWPAPSLVCRIAPRHTMTLVKVEEFTETDGDVPVAIAP